MHLGTNYRVNIISNIRGVRRNFEKGFPLQQSDCYIRVVYSLYYLTALLEYLDLFIKIIIQNNAISVAIMLETII